MPTLEAPDIETFEPVNMYRVLGVGYVSLFSPDGIRLDLSETGAARADQNPDLAGLLARMGTYIGEHGQYKATIDVPDREPGGILCVGESRQVSRAWGRKGKRLASIYHPDAAPDVIVKAFDYDLKSTLMQFYLGAWLHYKLAAADDGIRSPAQLAVFRAPYFGPRTTVMDYMPGQNLFDMALDLGRNERYAESVEEIDKIAIKIGGSLRQKIAKIGGWRGFVVANDLSTTSNIIDPDPETATPDNLIGRAFNVIDQPVVRARNMALLAAARRVPLAADVQPARQEATESPATFS